MDSPGVGPLRLARGPVQDVANDALASLADGRVGLEGVLRDLNRVAEPDFAPGRLTTSGFSWDREDSRSARWWPQGITTSADAYPDETFEGRSIVITTSYSKNLGGIHKGARISVVDVSDPGHLRYRHVLLVTASVSRAGAWRCARSRCTPAGSCGGGRCSTSRARRAGWSRCVSPTSSR